PHRLSPRDHRRLGHHPHQRPLQGQPSQEPQLNFVLAQRLLESVSISRSCRRERDQGKKGPRVESHFLSGKHPKLVGKGKKNAHRLGCCKEEKTKEKGPEPPAIASPHAHAHHSLGRSMPGASWEQ